MSSNNRSNRTPGYRQGIEALRYMTEVFDNLPLEFRRVLYDGPKSGQIPAKQGRTWTIEKALDVKRRYDIATILHGPYGPDHPQWQDAWQEHRRLSLTPKPRAHKPHRQRTTLNNITLEDLGL